MLRTLSGRLWLLRAASGAASADALALSAAVGAAAPTAAAAAATAAAGSGGLVRQLLPRRWLSSLGGDEPGSSSSGVGLGLAADAAAAEGGGDNSGSGSTGGGALDGSDLDARRLYVANLNFRCAASDVAEEFSRVGDVVDVVIPVDLDGRPRGFAFVEMATADAAVAATQRLDGSQFMGREMRVAPATPRGRARQRHTWGRSRGGEGEGGEGIDDDNRYSGGNGGRRPRKWNRRGRYAEQRGGDRYGGGGGRDERGGGGGDEY